MAFTCLRLNARSDWLILGHFSTVIPTGRYRTAKSKQNKTKKYSFFFFLILAVENDEWRGTL